MEALLRPHALLFRDTSMNDEISSALTRINRALSRIEVATARPMAPAVDGRYERLRARTQAALAQLDTVIARATREDVR